LTVPTAFGAYTLEATLLQPGSPPVSSVRDFAVLSEAQKLARQGLAFGKPVRASSVLTKDGVTHAAEHATDGKRATRWSSEFSDPQWLAVDLGEPAQIARVELLWEAAYAKRYAIQVSLDGQSWKDLYTTDQGDGNTDDIRFAPTQARWVRVHGAQRATPFGYSLWEFRVFPPE
jgi:hypothetical protein